MGAIAAAYRVRLVLLLAAGLGCTGFLSRATFVELPLLQDAVPTQLLIIVAAVTVATFPMYPLLPELSSTLVREVPVRAGLVALGLLLTALSVTPGRDPTAIAIAGSLDDSFALALLTIGIVAVLLVGDYAWMAVMGSGFLAILVNSAPSAPVWRGLRMIDSPLMVLMTLAAASVYVVLGPARLRPET